MSKNINRRQWMKDTSVTAGIVGLGFFQSPNKNLFAAARSANEKLNLAFVGVGGRGGANFGQLKDQNVVALCDVDGQRAKGAFESHSKVPKFQDYRKMLDKMENKIDGVVISTPDHTHFHPSYQALQMGKHIYLEKPLAHTVWETRTLCNLAKEKKVATQLGVQRHAIPNMHRVVELIKGGAIGSVSEVYCWIDSSRGMVPAAKKKTAIPDHLNYDLWAGPAAQREYDPKITPYGWRFWWDYGTGEMGNWGCHILDIPYWALDLKHPHHVSGSGPSVDAQMTPQSMKSILKFPANETRGPVTVHWDQAKGGPEILKKLNLPNKGNRALFMGSEGMLLCGFDRLKLYPEEKFGSEFKPPAPSIPDSPGFHKEWIAACKGGQPATCNFEYSGPMAETVLLANVAYRSNSQFDWDAKNMIASDQAAQKMLTKEYRKGWEVKEPAMAK